MDTHKSPLDRLLREAPQWLRHAYDCDAPTNQILNRCALNNCTEQEMWEYLAAGYFALKNEWQEVAIQEARIHKIIP